MAAQRAVLMGPPRVLNAAVQARYAVEALREQREALEILRAQAGEGEVAREEAAAAAREGILATQEASAVVRANVAAVGRNVRGIAAGVGRLEGTAGQILRGVRGISATARKEGWVKTIISSQLLMFIILFMTHTQFPVTSETISLFYFNIMRYVIPIRIFNHLRTGRFQATVGGVIYEISPLILTQIALTYTHDLSAARRSVGENGERFRELWAGTAEAAMAEFMRLPFEQMPGAAAEALPSARGLYESILSEVTTKWGRFRGLVKDNEDPAVIVQMINDYLNGKLLVTFNGVAHTLGVDRLLYQGTTFLISSRVIVTWLFSMLKQFIGVPLNAFVMFLCSTLYYKPESKWIPLPAFDMREACVSTWKSFYGSGGGKELTIKMNAKDQIEKMANGVYIYKDGSFLESFSKNIGEYMYLLTQLEIKAMFDPVYELEYAKVKDLLYDGLVYQLIILQSFNKKSINFLPGFLLIQPSSFALMNGTNRRLTNDGGGKKLKKKRRVTKKKMV